MTNQSQKSSDISKAGEILFHNGIFHIQGYPPAMLDRHVAELYETTTDHINLAAKRNFARFPEPDCRFRLPKSLKRQIVVILKNQGLIKENDKFIYLPWLYTQTGANNLSFFLNSDIAVERSLQIIKTFTDFEKGAHKAISEADRRKQELRDLLLLEQPQRWRKLFGDDYFEAIGQLREGAAFEQGSWRPYFLQSVSDVYSRLPPHVMEEIREEKNQSREKTATQRRRFLRAHHQFLSEDAHEIVKGVIKTALIVARCARTYEDFIEKWDRTHPPFGKQIPLLLTFDAA